MMFNQDLIFWGLLSSGLLRSANFLPTFRENLSCPIFKGQESDGTDRFSQNAGKKITTTRCVMAQKSAVLIYLEAEAWNDARSFNCLYLRQ